MLSSCYLITLLHDTSMAGCWSCSRILGHQLMRKLIIYLGLQTSETDTVTLIMYIRAPDIDINMYMYFMCCCMYHPGGTRTGRKTYREIRHTKQVKSLRNLLYFFAIIKLVPKNSEDAGLKIRIITRQL